MSNTQEKILDILKQPQLAGFASITADGKPWVRYVIIATSNDMVIRCATCINARKVNQIKNNPEVHITCGINDPNNVQPYLQIQGQAQLSLDKELRHKFWNDTLKNIFEGPDDPNYGVIEIVPYCIEYCSPDSMETETWSLE